MINLEILITLIAMFVAFFMVVYMLQKGSSWKKHIKRDYETLELAKQVKCDISKSENLTSLGLSPLTVKTEKTTAVKTQCRMAVVFSLLIFCAFLGWSYYLMTLQLVKPAALTMGYALACVLALLYAKSNIKKSQSEREQLREAVSRYEADYRKQPVGKAVPSGVAATGKVSVAEAGGVSLATLYELAHGCRIVPEDSCLKRHFLSQVMAEVEAAHPPRPTDSTLKRHHDTMLKDAFVCRLQQLASRVASSPAKPAMVSKPAVAAKPAVQAAAIPEDSTLRRHFLSQLRREIENSFGNRPTDSTLKRHYDTMVDAEFDKRLHTFSNAA